MIWYVLIILILIGSILALGVGLFLAATLLTSAPWVPTTRRTAHAMCELADLEKGDVVVDLGCGDAAILIRAAKEFSAKGIGVELNWGLVWYARLRVRLAGLQDKIDIRQGDINKIDLPDADVVFLYLLPKAMHRIEERLKERYNHLRVVSNGFELPDTAPTQELAAGPSTLRLYEW